MTTGFEIGMTPFFQSLGNSLAAGANFSASAKAEGLAMGLSSPLMPKALAIPAVAGASTAVVSTPYLVYILALLVVLAPFCYLSLLAIKKF